MSEYDYSAFFTGEPYPVSLFSYVCKLCDRPYKVDGKHTAQRYCSDECRRDIERAAKAKFRHHKLGEKPLGDPRVCIACGNPFYGMSANQKTCSTMCGKARQRYRNRVLARKKRGAKALADVRCNECNEIFHQARTNQTYCSMRCKNRF